MNEVADELRSIVKKISPMLIAIDDPNFDKRPRPNKWSRKEILGHLIDSACNNHQKFVRMMQQETLAFPGYRQDDWVDLQRWSQANWNDMISLWESYNRHIAFLIETVSEQFLKHTIEIEQAGPFTLEFIMKDYVEHLKHHIKQIFPELDIENSFVNVYNA